MAGQTNHWEDARMKNFKDEVSDSEMEHKGIRMDRGGVRTLNSDYTTGETYGQKHFLVIGPMGDPSGAGDSFTAGPKLVTSVTTSADTWAGIFKKKQALRASWGKQLEKTGEAWHKTQDGNVAATKRQEGNANNGQIR